jgi:23S rRNA (uracil1939-C5)-methyltransferase
MRAPSPQRPPPPDQVRIERVGAEGDGIGHLPDGTSLYVPLTLPDEGVVVLPLRRRGEGWQGVVQSVDSASPARAKPPCQHFGSCGGCVLQHWQHEPYQAWKSALLEAALRTAGFTPPDPLEMISGLPGERRRLDFAVRRAGGRVILGLHGPRSAEVIDLTDCLVLHPALLSLLAPLRALLHGMHAIRRQAEVVVNLLDAGPDLLLRSDATPSVQDRTALTGFARAHGLPRVSWIRAGDGGGGEPAGEGAETICQLRPATTTLSGVVVRPPPGAFLQATASGERAIVDAVLRGLAERPISRHGGRFRVAELYAGCGTMTFALAGAQGDARRDAKVGVQFDDPSGTRAHSPSGQLRVAAWEGDAALVTALKQAINQGGLSGRVEATQRDLTRQPLSAKELSGFAAVVLDPPHAGAAAQVAQTAAGVPTVVYVSCNPATLARDARLLKIAGYTLAGATAIDQFLWSARLEAVCVFRRAGERRCQ